MIKFILFCFIHNFLFLIQSLLVIFQKIFIQLTSFILCFMTYKGRIRTIWPDPDPTKRFGSSRIRAFWSDVYRYLYINVTMQEICETGTVKNLNPGNVLLMKYSVASLLLTLTVQLINLVRQPTKNLTLYSCFSIESWWQQQQFLEQELSVLCQLEPREEDQWDWRWGGGSRESAQEDQAFSRQQRFPCSAIIVTWWGEPCGATTDWKELCSAGSSWTWG